MKKMKFWSILLLMSVSLPLLNSCGSDDDDDGAKPLSVSPASVSMKYDESQQLSASGATSWRSENEFVASVDQNGLVKGRHIGSTDIVVSNGSASGKCVVSITPKYTYYDLPILNWGASETQIRNTETHTFESKSGDNLIYSYTNGTVSAVVMYGFKNGVLESVVQLTAKSHFVNAGYFLIERFQPYGESDGMYIFGDSMDANKAITVVGLDYMKLSSTTYTGAIYMKNSTSSNVVSRRSMEMIPEEIITAEKILNK